MRCGDDFLKGLMQCALRLGVEFWAKREKKKKRERERWRRSFYKEGPMSTAGGWYLCLKNLRLDFSVAAFAKSMASKFPRIS